MFFRTTRWIVNYLLQNSKHSSSPFLRVPICFYNRNYKLKYLRDMPPRNEAHIRCFENEDKFNLIFSVCAPDSAVQKKIYFQRNLQEPIENLFRRIISKISNDHTKKKKKRSKDEVENAPSGDHITRIQLLKNGSPVSGEVLCSDLFRNAENEDLVLKVGDDEFQVCINHPWIEKICLTKVLLAGFPAYPYKLDLLFADANECEYSWYRQSTKNYKVEGDPICSGIIYTPTTQDIGSYLKLVCIPRCGRIAGEAVETISDNVVEAGPGQCFFNIRHMFTKESLVGDSFRVVSYNILADLYASSVAGKTELFSYCPQYAMNIHYRKLLLLKELIDYNADLICLQEVDQSLFKRDLIKILNSVGFDGVFTKKGAEVNEGVSCFYRKSRFRLIENHSSLLSGEESREKPYWKSIWEKISSNEELFTFLNNLNTIVQVLVFEYVEKSDHKLIVANTHLYFRPNADVVRMLQAAFCLGLVNHVKKCVQEQYPDSTVSIVFCGDFNSTPECGVFQLFTEKCVPEDYYEWKSAPPEFKIEGMSLRNDINFNSACGTPEFTNFTVGFDGCLDYIYYNTDTLQVEEVLPFPSREEVSEHVAIPSIVFPSDHVALVADLKWRK